MKILRAGYKFFFFFLFFMIALVSFTVLDAIGMRHSAFKAAFKQNMVKLFNRAFALRLKVEGTPVKGPALMVANHQSYLDVCAIWANAGDVCFTPKSEVRSWPVVGYLAAKFDVMFVNRSPGKAKEAKEALAGVFREKRILCVFPEATTSDGRHMKPFRSSLFSIAEDWPGPQPLPVQPVSVVYETANGKPLDDLTWPTVAWYGDATFFGHMRTFFQHQIVEGRLVFHPPTHLLEGETRKELAKRCEAMVRSSLFVDRES